jgi:hypothetical protein
LEQEKVHLVAGFQFFLDFGAINNRMKTDLIADRQRLMAVNTFDLGRPMSQADAFQQLRDLKWEKI